VSPINDEMPLAPLSGSVTAITVYQVDLQPLVIQHLAPLRIQSSPVGLGAGPHRPCVTAGFAFTQRIGRGAAAPPACPANRAKLRWTELLGRSSRRANWLSPIGWLFATASRIWKVVRTLRIGTPVSACEPVGPYRRPAWHPAG
jgi:hypothetical protein